MFIPAFQYMVMKLAIKYVDITYGNSNDTEVQKLDKFNDSNNFGQLKANLICYLMAIGNGQKKQLIEFFQRDGNSFIPEPYGIVHGGISDYIFTTNLGDLLHFSDDACKVNTAMIGGNTIRSFVSIGLQGEELNLFNTTLNNIDKSITFIHQERQPRFAAMSFEKYSDYSQREEIYRSYSKEYLESIELQQTLQAKYGNEFNIDFAGQVLTVFNQLLPTSSHQFSPLGS